MLILDHIEKISKSENLIFLKLNEGNILIRNFKEFDLHQLFIYDYSYNILDKEDSIENIFQESGVEITIISERYKFIESQELRVLQV